MPRHIEEWLPPSMHQWLGQSLVASALLIGRVTLFKRRRPTGPRSAPADLLPPLALHSARMVVWWAIVTAPIIASLFDSLEQHQDERRPAPTRRLDTRHNLRDSPRLSCSVFPGWKRSIPSSHTPAPHTAPNPTWTRSNLLAGAFAAGPRHHLHENGLGPVPRLAARPAQAAARGRRRRAGIRSGVA